MRRLGRCLYLLAGVALFVGLVGMPSAQTAQNVYTLGAGDKLRIIVFDQENLSGEFELDSSGWIALPLIGEIRVTGLTLRQVEMAIREKLLEGFLKRPQVSVEVLNYRPYFIDGEIEKPGEYPFRQGTTVREAAAVAGGFTYWADKNEAYITSRNDPEQRKRKVSTSTLVQPGDYIWIEE